MNPKISQISQSTITANLHGTTDGKLWRWPDQIGADSIAETVGSQPRTKASFTQRDTLPHIVYR
jgi:hypothetical protein